MLKVGSVEVRCIVTTAHSAFTAALCCITISALTAQDEIRSSSSSSRSRTSTPRSNPTSGGFSTKDSLCADSKSCSLLHSHAPTALPPSPLPLKRHRPSTASSLSTLSIVIASTPTGVGGGPSSNTSSAVSTTASAASNSPNLVVGLSSPAPSTSIVSPTVATLNKNDLGRFVAGVNSSSSISSSWRLNDSGQHRDQQQHSSHQHQQPDSSTSSNFHLTTSNWFLDSPPSGGGSMSPYAVHSMQPVAALGLALAALLTSVGVITCLLTHFRSTPWYSATSTNTTLPMLALANGPGMDRELGAQRDRQIRLHSVHTDLQLDLPPSIPLPDGEEMIPYGSSTRLHIRDSEQEREIHQKCVRAPPNRTIFDGEGPPPYRCHSAGVLSSPAASNLSSADIAIQNQNNQFQCVVRSHSMSSSRHPHTVCQQHAASGAASGVSAVTGTAGTSSFPCSSHQHLPPVILHSTNHHKHHYHQPHHNHPHVYHQAVTSSNQSIVKSSSSNSTSSTSSKSSSSSSSSMSSSSSHSPSSSSSSTASCATMSTVTYSYTPPPNT